MFNDLAEIACVIFGPERNMQVNFDSTVRGLQLYSEPLTKEI